MKRKKPGSGERGVGDEDGQGQTPVLGLCGGAVDVGQTKKSLGTPAFPCLPDFFSPPKWAIEDSK